MIKKGGKLKVLFGIFIFLVSGLTGRGQTNLVPNPGFEEHHTCPSHLSQYTGIVKNWFTPTAGTPNYYHACATQPEVGVPYHYFGYKKAFEGSAYSGIMTSNAFREYISVELKSPLRAGKNYRIRFYSSVILQANCQSGGLDLLLSSHSPALGQSGTNLNVAPTLSVPIHYSDESWVCTQVCIRARGGEQFLTLGDLNYPTALHNCGEGEISYYFIDEVSLEEIIPAPPNEIVLLACGIPFPIRIDGIAVTGQSSIPVGSTWEWEDSVYTPARMVSQAGSYRLKLISAQCILSEYFIRVSDRDCRNTLFIPNIFTPDGDGINDYFEIHSSGIKLERLTIYNRIGQPVYSTTDPEFKWDGHTGSTSWPDGVYVYLIRYQVISSGQIVQISGSLTLVR